MAETDPDSLSVAAVQMTSGTELERNLDDAAALIAQAAAAGAELVVLPENFAFLGLRDAERIAIAEDDGDGPVQTFLAARAREHGLWLIGGTVPIRHDEGRASASCLVYDPEGARRARYDKVHLFDVALPGREERYRESDGTVPGDAPVAVATPWGRVALSVCYDVRFPELYRALAGPDLVLIAVPSAFTAATGRAHWSTLVRARAVENLCPLVAASQGGRHPSGRETWGHSLILDAWGEVLAELEQTPGVAHARLDLAAVRRLRERFPALDHRVL